MIKAVIFDMDGVLIDSNKAWYTIFNKALEHFGEKKISMYEFESEVWAQDFNKTARAYFSVGADIIREYFNEVYDVFNENLKLFKDSEQVLSSLKAKNIRLAVATNTSVEQAKKVLEDIKLADFFDIVMGGDSVENGKPEPDMLLKILDLLKLDKKDAIFVGDTIWDRMAAKKAGITFIGLGIKGDEKIGKLSQLLDLVK